MGLAKLRASLAPGIAVAVAVAVAGALGVVDVSGVFGDAARAAPPAPPAPALSPLEASARETARRKLLQSREQRRRDLDAVAAREAERAARVQARARELQAAEHRAILGAGPTSGEAAQARADGRKAADALWRAHGEAAAADWKGDDPARARLGAQNRRLLESLDVGGLGGVALPSPSPDTPGTGGPPAPAVPLTDPVPVETVGPIVDPSSVPTYLEFPGPKPKPSK